MTIHAGWYPYFGWLKIHDNEKRETTSSFIGFLRPEEIQNVNIMFAKIKSKICGKLGCICISLNEKYGNEISKKFIEEGLKCGFKNVEIIDKKTAEYLYAMSKLPYKPFNNDVIWLYDGYFVYVWQIIDQKAKYIGCWCTKIQKTDDLRNIVEGSKLKKEPDIFLCEDSQTRKKIIKKKVIKLSNKCIFFKYASGLSTAEGSLIKARIIAGYPDIAYLDAFNFLLWKTALMIGEKTIMLFEEYQQLPITLSQQLVKESNDEELYIISGDEYASFQLPNYKKIQLTFKIDGNGIYHVSFENIDKLPPKPKYFKRDWIPVENMKTMTSVSQKDYSLKNFNYPIPTKDTLKHSNLQEIGIDLGTTRCCAAVNRKNGITTVPLDNKGERLLPSYVAYDEKLPICGKIAVSRLRNHSKSTIFDSKRIIGRKFNDIESDENWSFSVSSENDFVYLEVIGNNNKKQKITAEEVAADLLKHIKQKSEDLQGTNITKAVVTVPATFTEEQKTATMRATKLAGWNETVLLPEPIAAAFAYFIDSATITDNSNILLFDLGGGTLDVCILKIENNQIEILSNTGDSKLGGRNFDTVLMNYFKNLMNTKYGISELNDKNYKLMLECQSIKEDLSCVLDRSLDINEYDTTKQGIIKISRAEFEKLSQTLLNKVKNTIHSELYISNLNANQINNVLLVGGGSRMPMIKQLLLDIFPFAIHCCEEHPDEVVAIGAAYYACSIFPSSKFIPPTPPMRMESIKR